MQVFLDCGGEAMVNSTLHKVMLTAPYDDMIPVLWDLRRIISRYKSKSSSDNNKNSEEVV